MSGDGSFSSSEGWGWGTHGVVPRDEHGELDFAVRGEALHTRAKAARHQRLQLRRVHERSQVVEVCGQCVPSVLRLQHQLGRRDCTHVLSHTRLQSLKLRRWLRVGASTDEGRTEPLDVEGVLEHGRAVNRAPCCVGTCEPCAFTPSTAAGGAGVAVEFNPVEHVAQRSRLVGAGSACTHHAAPPLTKRHWSSRMVRACRYE